MLSATMATPKKPTLAPGTAKPPKVVKGTAKPPKYAAPEPARQKSALMEAGEDAMRALLLKTLREHDWNLSAAAVALRVNGSGNLLRAIRQLGLVDEYEAAKAEGLVRPGPRPRE